MSIQYFKQRLRGGFESALLMRQGLSYFDGTPRETAFSFLILLISMPLSYISTHIHPPLGTEDFSPLMIYGVHFFSSMILMLIGFLILYGFSRYVTKNVNQMWLYYTVGNWVAAIFIPVSVLLMGVKYYDLIADKTMEDLMLVLRLYGFLIVGCLIFNVFRPPWELAGAIACLFIVMGNVVLDASYNLWDVPVVDYMEVYGGPAGGEAVTGQETISNTPED